MQNDVEQIFGSGISFADYRAQLRIHVRAFNDVYERLHFVRDVEAQNAPLGAARLLVLTEEFCIDSLLNLPLVARLVEASPGAKLRIARHDAHREFASRFPGPSGESKVPTILFLGPGGAVTGYWSERSAADRRWMAAFLEHAPIPEIVLEDGHPNAVLARWMERRLEAQLPFFEAESWHCVRDELAALAKGACQAPEAVAPQESRQSEALQPPAQRMPVSSNT